MGEWRGAGSAARPRWGSRRATRRSRPSAATGACTTSRSRSRRTRSRRGANYGAPRLRAHRGACSRRCAASTATTPVLRALGRYARRFRFEHPGPEELLAVVRRGARARSAAATLRAALFDKGWVDYVGRRRLAPRRRRVRGHLRRDGKREKVEPASAARGRLGRRRARAAARDARRSRSTSTDDGRRHDPREHWDGEGESKRFAWHGARGAARRSSSTRTTACCVDDEPREQPRARPRARAAARARTLERATYWMQLALQAVSP